MATYTLTMDYIGGIDGDKGHLFNVFYKFPNPENEFRAAMDESFRLLDLYSKAAATNVDLTTWIDWMSRKPSGFDIIKVEIPANSDEQDMYLKIASATKPQKKIIVNTHQSYDKFVYRPDCNRIDYEGNEIIILDSGEALQELHAAVKVVQNISNSIVADNGSIINKARNKYLKWPKFQIQWLPKGVVKFLKSKIRFQSRK